MEQQHRATLFYSCHQSDAILRDKLARFLRPLIRETHVEEWSAQQILPGAEFAQERRRALASATHILLLLSAEYLASDVCYQEMLEALKCQKCGKARVIPILLRPCLLPMPLEESLPCLPSNARPISTWQKRDKAFLDVALDICRILGLPPVSLRRRSTNRDRLLDRVFTYWIEGLLEPSLQEEGAHHELALQEQPGMVINPWSSQVQELRPVPHPLLTGKSIDQIYDQADGELLILGEPGAGKTVLLLELVQTLLERAEKNEHTRLPVVFHLSSWADERQPVRIWLVEELWTRYQVPRKIGRDWIDAGRVIPLLDGLDEMAKDARTACVEAINDYYQSQLEHHGSCSLVVCCRSEEYAALSTRVLLQSTINIQPLTDEQINAYLESFGEQGTALKQALDEDTELRNLARQPLMLHFFTLAYQDAQISEVPAPATPEKMRHAIFARYVEHMLNRREQVPSWMQPHFLYWLSYLAKQLSRQKQSLFSVKDLQSIWLADSQRRLYRWSFLLIWGLPFALSIWLYFAELREGNVGLAIPVYGLLSLLAAWLNVKGRGLNISLKQASGALIISLLYGFGVGLLLSLVGLLFGLLIGGFSYGVIGALSGALGGALAGFLGGILIVALLVGVAIWLDAFTNHFITRFFLWYANSLPWKLTPFLDEAAKRLFLRKVGNSYMFVHWLLRDHLASQEVPAFSGGASLNTPPNSPSPPK